MAVKEFFKEAAKKGTKLAGKTFIKSAFNVKTWVMIYMAVILTKGYNKLGNTLNREAEINHNAAQRIEQRVSTPEGMKATCEQYQLTEEEVKEVIDTQKEISNSQKVARKTAQDYKGDWRSKWLLWTESFIKKGDKDNLGVKNDGQLKLAVDAYEAAEADMKKKEQTKVRSSKTAGRR